MVELLWGRRPAVVSEDRYSYNWTADGAAVIRLLRERGVVGDLMLFRSTTSRHALALHNDHAVREEHDHVSPRQRTRGVVPNPSRALRTKMAGVFVPSADTEQGAGAHRRVDRPMHGSGTRLPTSSPTARRKAFASRSPRSGPVEGVPPRLGSTECPEDFGPSTPGRCQRDAKPVLHLLRGQHHLFLRLYGA